MTDDEKIGALRMALHNIIAAHETGLTGERTIPEFVLDVARYALERTMPDPPALDVIDCSDLDDDALTARFAPLFYDTPEGL